MATAPSNVLGNPRNGSPIKSAPNRSNKRVISATHRAGQKIRRLDTIDSDLYVRLRKNGSVSVL